MDAKKISKIRMSVSRAQNAGSRVRYSPFVRREIEQWLRAGESAETVAEKTGIGIQTISRWSEQITSDFQRVEIRSQSSSIQKLMLRFENGVRISTPTTELMIEMLKVLK
jgi:hypothetical protein